jgi:hypothetical protein
MRSIAEVRYARDGRVQAALLALSLLLIWACAPAQAGGSIGGIYELTHSTIAVGGGRSTGGSLEVNGTIGQHDAAPRLAAGGLTLQPGFWTAAESEPRPDAIFRDGFEQP